ncbi:MAG: hypothetical protein A2X45_01740 [Lentisphaerae bacterium GWF2_50_93]|nr:MAG: hypothetical protein A2X45_01740 [Lentisphaerae bacterium GWF2_50_93]
MAALGIGAQEQQAPAAAPAPAAPKPEAAQPAVQKEQIVPQFTKAQLEQLVAPIALYPDDLLAQVLAASTYPVDIVEAARWIKRNPSLDQDGINTELTNKQWDPSVKGLVFFPDLLAKMNDNLDWSKELGDAFLTQQKDLMDTIQVMRKKSIDAGVLKSNENQKVTTTEGQTEIQPTSTETVYVQEYVPSTAYGSSWHNDDWDYPNVMIAPGWGWNSYPYYWSMGYRCGWGNRAIAYGNNYYNGNFYRNNNNLRNANVNPANANRNWTHDAAHARQVTSNTQQLAKQLETPRTPQNFNAGNSAAAKELRQEVPQGDRTQAASKALQNVDRTKVAERAQNANRDGQNIANRAQNVNHSISGSGNANLERNYSDRGAQSRNMSKSQAVRSKGSTYSRSGGASKAGGAARSSGGGSRGGGGGRR